MFEQDVLPLVRQAQHKEEGVDPVEGQFWPRREETNNRRRREKWW